MKRRTNDARDLDYPLIAFSNSSKDVWTLRNAVEGVQIFGGIGSGKSSGSGKTIAYSLLNAGYGGVVLTSKMDETVRWLDYASEMDRLHDVIVFGERSSLEKYSKKYPRLSTPPCYFNPITYESNRPKEEGGGQTSNIVNLFLTIIKMGNRVSGTGGGGSSDPFWDLALERCMTAAINLLKFALKGDKGDPDDPTAHFALSVENMAKVVREAPKDKKSKTKNEKEEEEDDFDGYTVECLAHATLYIEDREAELANGLASEEDMEEFASEKRAYNLAFNYFMHDFKALPDDTRGSVTETFYAFANPFMSGLLADYFAQGTTAAVMPEKTFKGKIIILDFPVKKYLQVGINAQCIYKMLWQQAVERRESEGGGQDLNPVFLWVDESQYFLNQQDMMFQTTARSSKACTIFITQNISNYYAVMGGNRYKERVDSLLGNLATKIFHANNDNVTNEWAARTISRTFQTKMSTSIASGDEGTQNTSITETLNYQIEPHAFTVLKGGGPQNGFRVSAVITVAGKEWSNGNNYARIFFDQNPEKIFTL
ncbi:MAG: TraM recognition domain-containing protein [Bacteroidota bacterium]